MARPSPVPALSLPRKFGFALGDYACNLYWQSLSLFLMFYYTDAVGLSGGTAGVIYMIASIFDGAIDPVMGAIADRSRSRWGRYRPWILLGAVPLGLSFAGLYWRPALQGLELTAAITAAHLLFRVCYTIVSVPYSSLTARMTASSDERSTLAGFRMVFATLAGMTVSYGTQPIVARLGHGDPARGFFYAACAFALLSTAILPVVFAVTREPAESGREEPRLAALDYWRAVRGNRAFWVLMLGISIGAISSTVLGKAVLYYFKYNLHAEGAARYALALKAAAGVAIIPAWVFITRFTGKRMVWFLCAAWGIAGVGGFLLLGPSTPAGATAFFIIMQVASLGVSTTFWSMMPDTVEYGEWRSGLRAESFLFGLGMFFQKAALGLAAGLFGWSLDLVGYRANVAQTPQTLEGIKYIVAILPALSLASAAAAMVFYPLRKGGHEAIVDQLEARRLGGDPVKDSA